jgi:hypothetical protein
MSLAPSPRKEPGVHPGESGWTPGDIPPLPYPAGQRSRVQWQRGRVPSPIEGSHQRICQCLSGEARGGGCQGTRYVCGMWGSPQQGTHSIGNMEGRRELALIPACRMLQRQHREAPAGSKQAVNMPCTGTLQIRRVTLDSSPLPSLWSRCPPPRTSLLPWRAPTPILLCEHRLLRSCSVITCWHAPRQDGREAGVTHSPSVSFCL